jgi:hypothetical protein
MSLVNNHGEMFAGLILDTLKNITERLHGGDDNFGIAVQGCRKVFGMAVIIHNFNKATFVLNLHNGILQLPVYHNTVGDDNHRIKDSLIIIRMERGQLMSQPRYCVSLANATQLRQPAEC